VSIAWAITSPLPSSISTTFSWSTGRSLSAVGPSKRPAPVEFVFLTLVLLGLRRLELQALRWRDLDLLEGTLRVVESKSDAGERSIAIPATLLEALGERYRTTAYRGDDQLVFCHPTKGGTYNAETFAEALRTALKAVGVDAELRPFHDLRHASLTNGAAAGESPIALMTRAGHSNMSTTKLYLHLAGTVFLMRRSG